jgi:hypothetical protein
VIEITRLEKVGGPLTKSISLSSDGALISDGSACLMSRGRAQRVRLAGLGAVADLIQSLSSQEAIALGSMRRDLPDHVLVVTQDQLARLNGTTPPPPDTIARTGTTFSTRLSVLLLPWSTSTRRGCRPRSGR